MSPFDWSHLKLVYFWVGLPLFIIFGVIGCRLSSWVRLSVFALLILSLALPESLSISFLGDPAYKSSTRGIEITFSDMCALVLLFDLFLSSKKIYWIPPLTIPMWLFCLWAIVSWTQTEWTINFPGAAGVNVTGVVPVFHTGWYPIYEISKVIRGILLFWVTVNFIRGETEIKVLRGCIAALLIYFFLFSVEKRYIEHIHRVEALGHINILNAFISLLGGFIFPWIFESKKWLVKFGYALLVIFGLVVIVLTISRAALLGYVVMIGIGTVLMLIRFFSMRNLSLLLILFLLMLGAGAKSFSTLYNRFELQENTEVALEGRHAAWGEAVKMANESISGVGMGNFFASVVIKNPGIDMAHNIFYLTLGELGYFGLGLFLLIWLRLAQLWLSAFLRRSTWKDTFKYSTLAGVLLAFVAMIPSMLFHFSYRITPIYMLIQVLMAVVVQQYLNRATPVKAVSSLQPVK